MAVYRITSLLTSGVLNIRTSDGKSTPIGPLGFSDFTEKNAGMVNLESKNKLTIVKIAGDAVLASDLPPENAMDTETSAAIAAHNAAADPHPQYETSAETAIKVAAHAALPDPHSQYALDLDLSNHASAIDPHSQYKFKPKFFDYSANQATAESNHIGALVFATDKRNTGQVGGNFQGGGTGNKPIVGLSGFDNLPVSQLPVILASVNLLSRPTATDADERQDGLAFNVIIDLMGLGNTADFKVMAITNNLNQCTDIYGLSGLAASVTDFDINDFQVLTSAKVLNVVTSPYVAGEKAPFLKNHFYIVGGLANYVTNTNYRTDIAIDNTWPGIPMNLNVLLNGGVMPMTGATFTGGYPNCKIISAISFDGGHPARLRLPAILAQIGDSSLALRSVTEVTALSLNGINYLV